MHNIAWYQAGAMTVFRQFPERAWIDQRFELIITSFYLDLCYVRYMSRTEALQNCQHHTIHTFTITLIIGKRAGQIQGSLFQLIGLAFSLLLLDGHDKGCDHNSNTHSPCHAHSCRSTFGCSNNCNFSQPGEESQYELLVRQTLTWVGCIWSADAADINASIGVTKNRGVCWISQRGGHCNLSISGSCLVCPSEGNRVVNKD